MPDKPRLRRAILCRRRKAPLCSPSSSAEKCERGAVTKCQLGPLSLTRRHERSPLCLPYLQQVAFTMRIHGKVVVIAVCFGVFLLLYFLGGNGADDPLLKEVVEEEEEDGNSSPSPSGLVRDVASKFAKKPPAGVGVRTEELLKTRKEGKATNRGASVRAKGWVRDLQPCWAPFILHAYSHPHRSTITNTIKYLVWLKTIKWNSEHVNVYLWFLPPSYSVHCAQGRCQETLWTWV